MRQPGAGAARRLLERGGEVVFPQAHDRVCAELGCTFEPLRVSACRDDVRCAEELRRLHGDQSDGARRAEHQHAVVLSHRRAPCDRHPAGHPGDPARSRYLVGHRFRQGNAEVGRRSRALRQQAVAGDAEAVAEEVDARAVGGTADAFAAGDIRDLRMAAEVAAGTDVDVDCVQRDCGDLVDRLS